MGQGASFHVNGRGAELIQASKAGDADAVMELVSRHPQLLRFSNLHQLGPCHYAARADHVDILCLLVAKAEELDHRMLQQQQAAAAAARAARLPHKPQAPLPKLAHQVVNAATDRGVTPLMLAVGSGCIASVQLLLEKGADPWAVDKLGGRTALHYAARSTAHSDVIMDAVRLLVDAAGSNGPVRFPNRPNTKYIDVRGQTGFTALHFAVQANNQAVLAVLLDCGANPLLSSLFDCLDSINCCRGTTALHLAARYGNAAVAKQLLKAYMEQWSHRHLPDPRLLMDGDGQLPCQVAARRQHLAVARMVLPSTPLAALFVDGELRLLGPPSLASIAGGIVRAALAGDLELLVQQQQQEHEAATAGMGDGAAAAATEGRTSELCGMDAPEAAHGGGARGGPAPASPRQPNDGMQPQVLEPDAAEVGPSDPLGSSAPLSSLGDPVCGVCLDASPQVVLAPCGHELCIDCCQHMLALRSRCVMICPFCRAGVGHLRPQHEELPPQQQQQREGLAGAGAGPAGPAALAGTAAAAAAALVV